MTLAIKNGILHRDRSPVRQMLSPNVSKGWNRKPSIVVMHFTAGGGGAGSAAWLANPQSAASAHFVVDRDGTIIQCVSLDDRAWHAGKSAWKGLSGLNSYSVGIELANWGPLLDGGKTAGGKSVPFVMARHKNDGVLRAWEIYPAAQIAAAEALARAIAAYFPITEIVGHDDIAPGRKLDPGPAFDMGLFRQEVLGDLHTAAVTAARLNVRSGPGTIYPVVASLGRGDLVTIEERQREWVRIGAGLWVFGEYVA